MIPSYQTLNSYMTRLAHHPAPPGATAHEFFKINLAFTSIKFGISSEEVYHILDKSGIDDSLHEMAAITKTERFFGC